MNLTRQLIGSHLLSGTMTPGEEIALQIDQTLTQDALGMLCYIALEGMGIDRVRTSLSVSYLDHNLLYLDHKTPDDWATTATPPPPARPVCWVSAREGWTWRRLWRASPSGCGCRRWWRCA